jgi:hypothetical protein
MQLTYPPLSLINLGGRLTGRGSPSWELVPIDTGIYVVSADGGGLNS